MKTKKPEWLPTLAAILTAVLLGVLGIMNYPRLAGFFSQYPYLTWPNLSAAGAAIVILFAVRFFIKSGKGNMVAGITSTVLLALFGYFNYSRVGNNFDPRFISVLLITTVFVIGVMVVSKYWNVITSSKGLSVIASMGAVVLLFGAIIGARRQYFPAYWLWIGAAMVFVFWIGYLFRRDFSEVAKEQNPWGLRSLCRFSNSSLLQGRSWLDPGSGVGNCRRRYALVVALVPVWPPHQISFHDVLLSAKRVLPGVEREKTP